MFPLRERANEQTMTHLSEEGEEDADGGGGGSAEDSNPTHPHQPTKNYGLVRTEI